jgi:CTP synthase
VQIDYVDAEELEKESAGRAAQANAHAIIIPGGFGDRGIEGKINAVRYARENNVPILGICLGLQVMVIEHARQMLHLKRANSHEFDEKTPDPVIHMMEQQKDVANKGGTMRLRRLSVQPSFRVRWRLVALSAGNPISERHRHRYEVNNAYREGLEKAGFRATGTSPDNSLVEVMELKGHPWFLGCQFHPELKSRPLDCHPLFRGLIRAAVNGARRRRRSAPTCSSCAR